MNEQAKPEIPEDLRKNYNAAVFFGEPACTEYRLLIERIAALAAENAAIKQQAERLTRPVSDEELISAMWTAPNEGEKMSARINRILAARKQEGEPKP